jgi:hydroxyacylglutathione hydrolase
MHGAHDIVTIRCRRDNYAYLIHDPASGETTLIDAPEAAPIADALAARGWHLSHILLTHHHDDHIAGVPDLRKGAQVWGARADAHRLPPLDHSVTPGDTIPLAAGDVQVMDAPGHTIGHVAFYLSARDALFSGDSLMVHGCGRLFEGTPAQMLGTCMAMRALPAQTRLFSGHDYAAANLRFAAGFAPDPAASAARMAALADLAARGLPTTGITLLEDSMLNPYLRCDLAQVAQAAGLPGSTALEVLTRIRAMKDSA